MNAFAWRPASASRKAKKNEKLADPWPKSLQSAASGKESVVVALNAGREISKHALEWALTNVVQAGDYMTLLCVLHPVKFGSRRLWGLPKLAGDCANRAGKIKALRSSKEADEEARVACSQSLQGLHRLCNEKQVNVTVKVVSVASNGVVAMEAQSLSATWVVLDSQLGKEEAKLCSEQLQYNVVVVNKGDAKILQLSLRAAPESRRDLPECAVPAVPFSKCALLAAKNSDERDGGKSSSNHESSSVHGKISYPMSEEGASSSSPDVRTPFTASDKGTSSISSSERNASLFSGTEAAKTCTDDSKENGAPEVDDSDMESDYGLVDALSDDDSSHDESYGDVTGEPGSRMHMSISGRSDTPAHGSTIGYPKSSDVHQPHRRNTQGDQERIQIDPWIPSTKVKPTLSADVTPKAATHSNGRVSTSNTPLGSSKRLIATSRLLVSARDCRSVIHQVNASIDATKGGVLSQQRRSMKHSTNSGRPSINPAHPFDPDRAARAKKVLTTQDLIAKFSKWDSDATDGGDDVLHNNGEFERTFSVRKAMSLSKNNPPGPPPLCSICQHKAPVFGKPPRRFMYAELELATGGFSQANFLAEGGFGSVHRGVLPDGQAVAVKQYKLASSQGDLEFCSEVEVLSCAQHRNVVMLIGYCIEDKRRLLVYEFICNGSLDTHLYGQDTGCLEWLARQKIAVGAARGLRFLHEECRVGCIVHRDMRPNNILLTHDFEPMVGDFGLARWQPDGDLGVQTRVIGTFGYLAPEYAQSGQITEKADVYSFGVVLLELATGRKAVDLNRPKGQQCLTEWARPLLEKDAVHDLIDPLLDGNYSEYEAYCMLHVASLCVRKDPQLRPRMSQVLRMLEGDVVIDKSILSTPYYGSNLTYDIAGLSGSRSSRMFNEYAINRAMVSYSGSLATDAPDRRASAAVSRDPLVVCHANGKLTYEALKAAYKGRAHTGRLSYEDS